MAKIIYLPLEHIGMRYTSHLDRDIRNYLHDNKINHIIIEPETINGNKEVAITNGSFLDAPNTLYRQSKQWCEVLRLIDNGTIASDDILFTTDIWNLPLIGLPYLNYFTNCNIKLRGVLHAGSFTDTDFVRQLERYYNKYEEVMFDIADKVFVASDFIKDDVLTKRTASADKLIVTGLPLDFQGMNSQIKQCEYNMRQRKNQVVFSGRNVDEKQPHLFYELKRKVAERLPDLEVSYINTHDENFSKSDYYDCLLHSKVAVSFALQENFGYAIQEAHYLGCKVIVPNRLVYPELYNQDCLYDTFDECVEMVCNNLLENDNDLNVGTQQNNYKIFNQWFQL